MNTLTRRGLLITILGCIFLSGCNRHSGGASKANGKKGNEIHIQPVVGNRESEQWGYLALRITKVLEGQRLLDTAPWFAVGGDWTCLECEFAKNAPAKVIIGVRTKNPPSGDIPVAWGEALLAVSDPGAGTAFIEAFANAFHQTVPARHGDKPRGLAKISTAVLGDNQVRDPAGGFTDGHGGKWTATKWFFGAEAGEAEVFFNYSIADKLAEFSEKDEEYREDLVQQLVIGLRDGPLPERTPENDPALSLVGPKIVGWNKIANSNESCQFTPDGRSMLIVSSEKSQNSKLFIAPRAHPIDRKILGEWKGLAQVEECFSTVKELTLLVKERIQKKPGGFTSDDAEKLWWVQSDGKHEMPIPSSVTEWHVFKNCLSPDKRFLALHSWHKQSKEKNIRVINLCALQSGNWEIIKIPETSLELIGWTDEKARGIVLTGISYDKKEIRKAYSLDPETAKLSPSANGSSRT
jgi:hypothetical protein